MIIQEKTIKPKLGFLEVAKQLGSFSQACHAISSLLYKGVYPANLPFVKQVNFGKALYYKIEEKEAEAKEIF